MLNKFSIFATCLILEGGGGGGGAVCFLDVDFMWILVLTIAWLNNLLLKVLLPVLSEVPGST